MTMKFQAYL